MLSSRRAELHTFDLESLSHTAVDRYQRMVQNHYPAARWITDQEFGRIVAGTVLLSLRFSLIDPLAQAMAWRDAAQRLGKDSIASDGHPPFGLRRQPLLSGRQTR